MHWVLVAQGSQGPPQGTPALSMIAAQGARGQAGAQSRGPTSPEVASPASWAGISGLLQQEDSPLEPGTVERKALFQTPFLPYFPRAGPRAHRCRRNGRPGPGGTRSCVRPEPLFCGTTELGGTAASPQLALRGPSANSVGAEAEGGLGGRGPQPGTPGPCSRLPTPRAEGPDPRPPLLWTANASATVSSEQARS